jgi:hypothetical protein
VPQVEELSFDPTVRMIAILVRELADLVEQLLAPLAPRSCEARAHTRHEKLQISITRTWTFERDLYDLIDVLERRLVGITPGAPLTNIPPGGRH